ncbi:hypothetical protein [Methylocystis sp.]|uniref:hypothetical protein n=1 Tax=Methylocystis sp. TaxID=1911079 RepID=UPI002734055D|nr:hypothetical protein [Methylocystis sp.]MDP3552646.1 hypothetical protein [Methylocystis sp.]
MQTEMNEMRSIVIMAKVSKIWNDDRVTIHPNDDPNQSITVPASDVLAFGDGRPKEENAAQKAQRNARG